MFALLRLRLGEVLAAVAPLIGVSCVLQLAFVRAPAALFLEFLAGSLLATAGMSLLFTGIDLGILPMGRYIGAELPRRGSLWFIAAVAFVLGLAVTVAEPDVLVLAGQVEAASGGDIAREAVIYLAGAGVGIFSSIALLRVVRGFSMIHLLTAVYSVIILLSFLALPEFVPLAYDAGSVTTGVLTTPVLLALARGLSSVLAGRSAVSDGFGLLGLASAGPILVILLVGTLLR